ncbi:hypothetical protein AB0H51_28010 [Streptomyces griseoluteus]|uniref:hypothetical protein n=1 Tax=Streptomyces griseoluteus TaxID=29306 RepID=UPI0033D86A74
MARNIGADGSAVYRAVITITDRKTGEESLKYEGPYSTPGAAHGRVSFWVNYLAEYDDYDRRTGSRATGVVERAHTVWLPAGAPAPQQAPADPGRPIPLDIAECPGTCPCRRTNTPEEPSK